MPSEPGDALGGRHVSAGVKSAKSYCLVECRLFYAFPCRLKAEDKLR